VQKDGKDIGVYTKIRGGEALAGLALTVIGLKKNAELINIVGDIKPLKDVGAARSTGPQRVRGDGSIPPEGG
jgi:hypothetical protein